MRLPVPSLMAACLLTMLSTAAFAQPALDAPEAAWFPKAPALPKPTGQVIRVASVEELFRAAEEVEPGGTILLADGHYMMPRYFELRTDNVTLRSASGRRERVILDNVTRDLTAEFADTQAGDLHLRRRVPEVVDAAEPLPEVVGDVDGRRRGDRPDVGADEWVAEPPPQR